MPIDECKIVEGMQQSLLGRFQLAPFKLHAPQSKKAIMLLLYFFNIVPQVICFRTCTVATYARHHTDYFHTLAPHISLCSGSGFLGAYFD